jgi:hypothetical protein
MNNLKQGLLAWKERFVKEEDGMATAEYAIGTVAAAAFAGLLLLVIRGGDIQGLITSLIQSALKVS